jgi:transcriptional regulator with XRE-family HTH domain
VNHQDALGTRIRTARLNSGLTINTAAKTTGVSTTTWNNWERGLKRPASARIGAIASALGIPVSALYVGDGYTAVTEVVLSPESVERVRTEGDLAAQELAALVAAQLPALILNACQPSRAKPARKALRRRRSRDEIRAGIENAKAARQRRLEAEAAWRAGGEGPTSQS